MCQRHWHYDVDVVDTCVSSSSFLITFSRHRRHCRHCNFEGVDAIASLPHIVVLISIDIIDVVMSTMLNDIVFTSSLSLLFPICQNRLHFRHLSMNWTLPLTRFSNDAITLHQKFYYFGSVRSKKGAIFRITREFFFTFTHMETSPLPVNGCNFFLCSVSSASSLACYTYCDTGHPFIIVINENP